MTFTSVDMIIIAIVLGSALMALLRGLTREILTIVAWVVAAIGAIYGFPMSRGIFREQLTNPMMADGAAFLVVFLVILIPALFLANHIIHRFNMADPGVLDRSGGFLFGVARGLFIIGLAYWANLQIMEEGTEPGWIQDAKLKPLVVSVAEMFPSELGALTNSTTSQNDTPDPKTNQSSAKEEETDSGYDQNDRRGLDQLITTTSEE